MLENKLNSFYPNEKQLMNCGKYNKNQGKNYEKYYLFYTF
jgi:hypothetical protein